MVSGAGKDLRDDVCFSCLRIPQKPVSNSVVLSVLASSEASSASSQGGASFSRASDVLLPRELAAFLVLKSCTRALRSGKAGTRAVHGAAREHTGVRASVDDAERLSQLRDAVVSAEEELRSVAVAGGGGAALDDAECRFALAGASVTAEVTRQVEVATTAAVEEVHDDSRRAAAGSRMYAATDSPERGRFMEYTASLGLININPSTHVGMLTLLLLFRTHAVLGPLSEERFVAFLTDCVLWRFYWKLCLCSEINQRFWRAFLGRGVLPTLGVGLHVLKDHCTHTWKSFRIFLESLVPAFLAARTRLGGEKGNYFPGAKLSMILAVFGPMFAASVDVEPRLSSLAHEHPDDARLSALLGLLSVHIPQMMCHAVASKLWSSPELEIRQLAFDASLELLRLQVSLQFEPRHTHTHTHTHSTHTHTQTPRTHTHTHTHTHCSCRDTLNPD